MMIPGPFSSQQGEAMTLLKKNLLGLVLTLVGGLALAHGAVTSQAWETILGLIVLGLGVLLLALKIVRRNTPTAER
jgi:uncharacterized membrane protein HdeD (DUF308 family)